MRYIGDRDVEGRQWVGFDETGDTFTVYRTGDNISIPNPDHTVGGRIEVKILGLDPNNKMILKGVPDAFGNVPLRVILIDPNVGPNIVEYQNVTSVDGRIPLGEINIGAGRNPIMVYKNKVNANHLYLGVQDNGELIEFGVEVNNRIPYSTNHLGQVVYVDELGTKYPKVGWDYYLPETRNLLLILILKNIFIKVLLVLVMETK